MNIKQALLSITGITIVSLSLVALAVEQGTDNRAFIRLSEDGSKAARAISEARVAIFDGQTQEAKDLLSQAKTALAVAARDVDKMAIKKPKDSNAGPMIPIDARLSVADAYSLTPEKKAEIDKVNAHLHKGETRKAVETLRPIDVQVTLTSLFMPLDPTTKAVDQAETLIADNKYYEANLALKQAEDSWVTDSQSFVEYLDKLPDSGKQTASSAPAAPANPPVAPPKEPEN